MSIEGNRGCSSSLVMRGMGHIWFILSPRHSSGERMEPLGPFTRLWHASYTLAFIIAGAGAAFLVS